MTALCTICHSPLDIPDRPWTIDCGGDCLACMAEAGDPDCVAVLAPFIKGSAQMKADQSTVERVSRALARDAYAFQVAAGIMTTRQLEKVEDKHWEGYAETAIAALAAIPIPTQTTTIPNANAEETNP